MAHVPEPRFSKKLFESWRANMDFGKEAPIISGEDSGIEAAEKLKPEALLFPAGCLAVKEEVPMRLGPSCRLALLK